MVSCKKSPLYLDWHLLMMSLMATRSFCGAYLSTILMRPGWETRRVRDLRALFLFQTQATHTTTHTFTESTNTTQIIVHFPNLTLQPALIATCLFSGCLCSSKCKYNSLYIRAKSCFTFMTALWSHTTSTIQQFNC